jgi:hypothetical protein
MVRCWLCALHIEDTKRLAQLLERSKAVILSCTADTAPVLVPFVLVALIFENHFEPKLVHRWGRGGGYKLRKRILKPHFEV